jgi:predicted enzyme related to lactoylglutathione lyase
MTRPIGAPCWMDLMTSDEGRAREFYGELFGWTAGEGSAEFGGYFMFLRDGVPVAGAMQKVTGVPVMEGPDQLTSDYAGSVAFYEQVFGWQTRVASDTPEFRDTVLTAGGEDFAGIVAAQDGDLAAGAAGRWEVFFRVADTDAALARVVELGGTVLRAAADTPFGRLAEAADPTGARLRLAG